MKFLRNALDDTDENACGKCVTCRPDLSLPRTASRAQGLEAVEFLRHGELPLPAKKLLPKGAFPVYRFEGNLEKQGLSSETGRILSRWYDAGWGRLVAENTQKGTFDDALIDAAASMTLERWKPDPPPRWVACVPSLNHPELVPGFAGGWPKGWGFHFWM